MLSKFVRQYFSVFVIASLLASLLIASSESQEVRIEPRIPDVPGYFMMKCDFHIHTVFSDGEVWPTVRAEEAWRHGLDAFALTDHIEYLPHKADMNIDFNRPYEIAKPSADSLNIILIKGAEITRSMPPGHLNAIFLKDVALLKTDDYKDSIKAAIDQGAFVFWNHPTFPQPEGKNVWYPEHEELYQKGFLKGIEVVNGLDYNAQAHKWCLEKKLTMMANSDVHDPINLDYDISNGQLRPMTIVLAKEKSVEGIKEALFARRTIVYSQNMLVGESDYLKPIFDGSIEISNPQVTIKGKGSVRIEVYNKSDITYELTSNGELPEASFPKNIKLPAGKSILFTLKGKSTELSVEKEIGIPYKVKNLLIAPNEGLPVELKVKVNFVP
jgi:3',5'-nucleoside bisphosphate phosphatase